MGQRDVNDPRNQLYLEFYKTVKLANPTFFVIENVRGLLTLDKGAFVKDILNRFGENGLGYTISYQLINAADYGIPQNRYRVFFVGMKGKKFKFPKPYNYKLTAKDGISDLETTQNGGYATLPANEYQRILRDGQEKPLNHDFTIHTEQTIAIISQIPDGGNIKSLPPEYWQVRKYNKAFERMGTFKPSNTIDTGHRNYFHYLEHRIPTVRESARIQSFPDSFEIIGNRGSQYKQIGNAVPPMLAHIIADEIKRQLKL